MALENILFAYAVSGSLIERNVDAAFFHVARNVLPEIGELQRGAGCVRKALAVLIAITAKVKDQAADGIGGIYAVISRSVDQFG